MSDPSFSDLVHTKALELRGRGGTMESRHRVARELRAIVRVAARDAARSPERLENFMSDANHVILKYTTSVDVIERLTGVIVLDELIEPPFEDGNSEARLARLASHLRRVAFPDASAATALAMSTSNTTANALHVMELTLLARACAHALGRFARLESPVAAEAANSDIRRALQCLNPPQTQGTTEAIVPLEKAIVALHCLRGVLDTAPNVTIPHLSSILTVMWRWARDTREYLREPALASLKRAIQLATHRPPAARGALHQIIFHEIGVSFNKASADASLAALAAIGELLACGDYSLQSRLSDIYAAVLKQSQHRETKVREAVIGLLPKLTAFAPPNLIPAISSQINQALKHLITTLARGAPESMACLCFAALGEMTLTLGPSIEPSVEIILALIKDALSYGVPKPEGSIAAVASATALGRSGPNEGVLSAYGALDGKRIGSISHMGNTLRSSAIPSASSSSSGPTALFNHALVCAAMVARAVGPALIPYAENLVDLMFRHGLSEVLAVSLSHLAATAPALLPAIQQRLLASLAPILTPKPSPRVAATVLTTTVSLASAVASAAADAALQGLPAASGAASVQAASGHPAIAALFPPAPSALIPAPEWTAAPITNAVFSTSSAVTGLLDFDNRTPLIVLDNSAPGAMDPATTISGGSAGPTSSLINLAQSNSVLNLFAVSTAAVASRPGGSASVASLEAMRAAFLPLNSGLAGSALFLGSDNYGIGIDSASIIESSAANIALFNMYAGAMSDASQMTGSGPTSTGLKLGFGRGMNTNSSVGSAGSVLGIGPQYIPPSLGPGSGAASSTLGPVATTGVGASAAGGAGSTGYAVVSAAFGYDLSSSSGTVAGPTAAIHLALRTLGTFNFEGYDLLPYVRSEVMRLLDDDDPTVRRHAAVCCLFVLRRICSAGAGGTLTGAGSGGDGSGVVETSAFDGTLISTSSNERPAMKVGPTVRVLPDGGCVVTMQGSTAAKASASAAATASAAVASVLQRAATSVSVTAAGEAIFANQGINDEQVSQIAQGTEALRSVTTSSHSDEQRLRSNEEDETSWIDVQKMRRQRRAIAKAQALAIAREIQREHKSKRRRPMKASEVVKELTQMAPEWLDDFNAYVIRERGEEDQGKPRIVSVSEKILAPPTSHSSLDAFSQANGLNEVRTIESLKAWATFDESHVDSRLLQSIALDEVELLESSPEREINNKQQDQDKDQDSISSQDGDVGAIEDPDTPGVILYLAEAAPDPQAQLRLKVANMLTDQVEDLAEELENLHWRQQETALVTKIASTAAAEASDTAHALAFGFCHQRLDRRVNASQTYFGSDTNDESWAAILHERFGFTTSSAYISPSQLLDVASTTGPQSASSLGLTTDSTGGVGSSSSSLAAGALSALGTGTLTIVRELLHRLLAMVIADPDPAIRAVILELIDSRFDPLLLEPGPMRVLVTAQQDADYGVREVAVSVLCRLASKDPALCVPPLHNLAMKLISELGLAVAASAREAAVSLLGHLVSRAPEHMVSLLDTCLAAALPHTTDSDPSLAAAALGVVGRLLELGGPAYFAHAHQIVPRLIAAILVYARLLASKAPMAVGPNPFANVGGIPRSSARAMEFGVDANTLSAPASVVDLVSPAHTALVDVALNTLRRLVCASGWVVAPYLLVPPLQQALLLIVRLDTSKHLRRAASRLLGVLGTPDPSFHQANYLALALSSPAANQQQMHLHLQQRHQLLQQLFFERRRIARGGGLLLPPEILDPNYPLQLNCRPLLSHIHMAPVHPEVRANVESAAGHTPQLDLSQLYLRGFLPRFVYRMETALRRIWAWRHEFAVRARYETQARLDQNVPKLRSLIVSKASRLGLTLESDDSGDQDNYAYGDRGVDNWQRRGFGDSSQAQPSILNRIGKATASSSSRYQLSDPERALVLEAARSFREALGDVVLLDAPGLPSVLSRFHITTAAIESQPEAAARSFLLALKPSIQSTQDDSANPFAAAEAALLQPPQAPSVTLSSLATAFFGLVANAASGGVDSIGGGASSANFPVAGQGLGAGNFAAQLGGAGGVGGVGAGLLAAFGPGNTTGSAPGENEVLGFGLGAASATAGGTEGVCRSAALSALARILVESTLPSAAGSVLESQQRRIIVAFVTISRSSGREACVSHLPLVAPTVIRFFATSRSDPARAAAIDQLGVLVAVTREGFAPYTSMLLGTLEAEIARGLSEPVLALTLRLIRRLAVIVPDSLRPRICTLVPLLLSLLSPVLPSATATVPALYAGVAAVPPASPFDDVEQVGSWSWASSKLLTAFPPPMISNSNMPQPDPSGNSGYASITGSPSVATAGTQASSRYSVLVPLQVLLTLQVIGPSLNGFLHLVLPPLIELWSPESVITPIVRYFALHATAQLLRVCDFTDQSSKIVLTLLKLLSWLDCVKPSSVLGSLALAGASAAAAVAASNASGQLINSSLPGSAVAAIVAAAQGAVQNPGQAGFFTGTRQRSAGSIIQSPAPVSAIGAGPIASNQSTFNSPNGLQCLNPTAQLQTLNTPLGLSLATTMGYSRVYDPVTGELGTGSDATLLPGSVAAASIVAALSGLSSSVTSHSEFALAASLGHVTGNATTAAVAGTVTDAEKIAALGLGPSPISLDASLSAIAAGQGKGSGLAGAPSAGTSFGAAGVPLGSSSALGTQPTGSQASPDSVMQQVIASLDRLPLQLREEALQCLCVVLFRMRSAFLVYLPLAHKVLARLGINWPLFDGLLRKVLLNAPILAGDAPQQIQGWNDLANAVCIISATSSSSTSGSDVFTNAATGIGCDVDPLSSNATGGSDMYGDADAFLAENILGTNVSSQSGFLNPSGLFVPGGTGPGNLPGLADAGLALAGNGGGGGIGGLDIAPGLSVVLGVSGSASLVILQSLWSQHCHVGLTVAPPPVVEEDWSAIGLQALASAALITAKAGLVASSTATSRALDPALAFVGPSGRDDPTSAAEGVVAASDPKSRATREEFLEWLNQMAVTLLRYSPSLALRTCAPLAQRHPILAKRLFNLAFATCWDVMTDRSKDTLIQNFESILKNQAAPTEVCQAILALAEFMDHEGRPLPLSLVAFTAVRCRKLALALRQLELEIRTTCKPEEVVESLVSLHDRLRQTDAASGILTLARTQFKLEVREDWYEKLRQWDRALAAYTHKELQLAHHEPSDHLSQTRVEATLGRLRCLHTLGEFGQVAAISESLWSKLILAEQGLSHMPSMSSSQAMAAVNTGTSTAASVVSGPTSVTTTMSTTQQQGEQGHTATNNQQMTAYYVTGPTLVSSVAASLRAELAQVAASSLLYLGRWSELPLYFPSLPADSFDGALLRAVYCVHRENMLAARHHIARGRALVEMDIMASSLDELASKTQRISLQLQQLTEVEEGIELRVLARRTFAPGTDSLAVAGVLTESDHSSQGFSAVQQLLAQRQGIRTPQIAIPTIGRADLDAATTLSAIHASSYVPAALLDCAGLSMRAISRKLHIRATWTARLRALQKSVAVWRQVLAVRALAVPPADDVPTWLKFAALCRREGRLSSSLRVITALLGRDPYCPEHPFTAGGTEVPRTPHDLLATIDSGEQPHQGAIMYHHNETSDPAYIMWPSPLDDPRVTFAFLQHLWSAGPRHAALDRLRALASMVDGALSNKLCPTCAEIDDHADGVHPIDTARTHSERLAAAVTKASSVDRLALAAATARVTTVASLPLATLLAVRAKIYRYLGDWAYAVGHEHKPDLDASEIMDVLRSYQEATETAPYDYKAWHAWALMNFRVVQRYKLRRSALATLFKDKLRAWETLQQSQSPKGKQLRTMVYRELRALSDEAVKLREETEKYVISAVRGFFRSIPLATLSSQSLQDVLRLLSLWFGYGSAPAVREPLIQGFNCTPSDTWVPVMPQIIARIDSASPSVKGLIHDVLTLVGREKPQAIVYLITVAAKTKEGSDIRLSVLSQVGHPAAASKSLASSPAAARALAAYPPQNGSSQSSDAAKVLEILTESTTALTSATAAMQARVQWMMDNTALSVISALRERTPKLIDQALVIAHELIRSAVLWHDIWAEALEEASKAWFGRGDADAMLAALLPLHAMLYDPGPETPYEIGFIRTFGAEFAEAYEWCLRYLRTRNGSDLNQAWDLYCQIFKGFQRADANRSGTLELRDISPRLLAARNLELAVPGTADSEQSSGRDTTRIAYFVPNLTVIFSKQRPRRLGVVGDDGVEYGFLLKGKEDLRQDARVMQLVRLVNALFAADPAAAQRDLSIRSYSVIPLAPMCGLIQWLSNCDTLHSLIKDYRDSSRIPLNLETRLIQVYAPFQQKHTIMQHLEAFDFALSVTSGEDLDRAFWLKAPTSEIWLEHRTNYTRTLAVMSMVGYILGLGDRHPCNIMVDRATGKIVHIDFGDCFEVAMQRDKFPERVPFRLTRMLIKAMEVSGIEGTFRITASTSMHVLRANVESLTAVLEAFVYDPLISWRLVGSPAAEKAQHPEPELVGKPTPPPEIGKPASDTSPEQQISSSASSSIEASPHIMDDDDDGLPDIEFQRRSRFDHFDQAQQEQKELDNIQIDLHAKMTSPELTNTDELALLELRGTDQFPGSLALSLSAIQTPFDEDDQGSELNARALEVVARVESKLTGRDFGAEILPVDAQVEKLIREATNMYYLSQCYVGWCGFW